MSVPWWGWLIVVLVAAVVVLRASVRSYRRGVRERLIAFIRERHPDMEVLDADEGSLSLRSQTLGEGRLFLASLYRAIAAARCRTPEEEQTLFAHFLSAAREYESDLSGLSLETHGERLMPRFVPAGSLADVAANGMPSSPLLSVGLEIVYVLDSEHSVRFLTNDDLGSLGIDQDALHARCLENLGRRFDPDIVRHVAEEHAVTVVKAGDSYDAVRLLLVPPLLRPGEEIVAILPDRDTLALMPLPPDNDWGKLLKMARTPASDKILLNRPVRVTREGFRLV